MAVVEPSVELVEWAVADRPLRGAAATGDAAVCLNSGEQALVAAIDGLGHGTEAATAAAAALHVLRRHAAAEITALVRRCHEELAGTRGAAMSLASFDATERTMAWVAIGNVEGRLVRRDHAGRVTSRSLLLPGGAVGHEMPLLAPATLDVRLGDLLIFATDGIENDFAETVDLRGSVAEISARILRAKRKATDDALVVVARYVERGLGD
jgi:negative regulator of sigma-B (phosphoserine phosphatase)